MAFINTRYCHTCKQDTKHNHFDCLTCQERHREEGERAWAAQSLDDKLLDLHRRLLAVERGAARF